MTKRLKHYLSGFVSLLLPPPEDGQFHGWWTICGIIAFPVGMSIIFYEFAGLQEKQLEADLFFSETL